MVLMMEGLFGGKKTSTFRGSVGGTDLHLRVLYERVVVVGFSF